MSQSGNRPYLPQLQTLTGGQYRDTLVQKLTPVADKVRNLATRLGGRPYEVFLVRTRWSGGRRNAGTEEVLSAEALVPTPTVSTINALTQMLQSVGLDEAGTVVVSGISPSYTEDQLVGIGPQGQPVAVDENFYWEIVYPRPAPDAAVRRRYALQSAPDYRATRFGWTVTLIKAGEERDRVTGLPQGD